MDPNTPQPQASDAAAMASIIGQLPTAPAPTPAPEPQFQFAPAPAPAPAPQPGFPQPAPTPGIPGALTPTPAPGAPAPQPFTPAPTNPISFDDLGQTSIINQPQPPLIPQAPAGVPQQYAQPPLIPSAPQPGAVAPPPIPAPQQPPAPNPNYLPLQVPAAPTPPATPQGGFSPEQVQSMIDTAVRAAAAGNAPAPAPAAPVTPGWDDILKNGDHNWNDVQTLVQQQIEQGISAGLSRVEAERQAQETQQAEAARQQEVQVNQYIDGQIAQLETTGYLPRINPTDPNDPGRAAHQELFAYAIAQGTDNLTAVAPTLYALHQNGYYFDRGTNALVRRGSQSAAAQAPIAGASPTLTAPNAQPTGPSLADLRTKTLDQLAEEANRAFPTT